MRHVKLTGTDLTVSQLCLGTNQFGTSLDQQHAGEILDAFASHGGNFIDTARSYADWVPDIPRGISELTLGQLLRERKREDWIVATKGCEFDWRADEMKLRVNPEVIKSEMDASLEALQIDRIDLYWLHRDDPSQPVGPLIDTLIAAQEEGKIRYFGCSNWRPERIREAQEYAGSLGHQGFVASQPM